MVNPDLRELAAELGVLDSYVGWQGSPVLASEAALVAALVALAPGYGLAFSSAADASSALAELRLRRSREVVAPVAVCWREATPAPQWTLTAWVRADLDARWEILHQGVTLAHGSLFWAPASDHQEVDGITYCRRALVLPMPAEGYHVYAWQLGDVHGEVLVIAAPLQAYGAPSATSRLGWGVFAPLYGLARGGDGAAGQIGDFGTLGQLMREVAAQGGHYVGTLPLLSAFLDQPFEVSPYSPASKLYWNELYVDLEAAAARLGVALPAEAAPAVAASVAELPYRDAYRTRRATLNDLAQAAWAQPHTRAEVLAWAEAEGACDYAGFRALGEVWQAPWWQWPVDNVSEVRTVAQLQASLAQHAPDGTAWASAWTHLVAQWLCQTQLSELARTTNARLYLDLPVGATCAAYEVWRHRELFMLTMAAGAPPDELFLGGQNWGLPPVHPEVQRRQHYRYFIATLRALMRVAGVLRIDHVMGLFRLYCVPEGLGAKDGVYIKYPAEELLAIVTLESQRARCAVVGEDLGTVPDYVPPAMARHGLYGLYVGQFALPASAQTPLAMPQGNQVASLNTHDTATFAGWWLGRDIDDRVALGLIDSARATRERAERADARRLACAEFGVTDAEPASLAAAAGVRNAMVARMAQGDAGMVLVTLEDLWLEPQPQNVPGTSTERPNWRRPMAVGLAQALAAVAGTGLRT